MRFCNQTQTADGRWRREDAGQYGERGSWAVGGTLRSAPARAPICAAAHVSGGGGGGRSVGALARIGTRLGERGGGGMGPRSGSGGTYLLEKLHMLLSLYFHGTRRSDQQHEAAHNSHRVALNEATRARSSFSFLLVNISRQGFGFATKLTDLPLLGRGRGGSLGGGHDAPPGGPHLQLCGGG